MKLVKVLLAILLTIFILAACEEESSGGEGTSLGSHVGGKEKGLREENLEKQEDLASKRKPCDTLSLQEHILETYPDGQYLVEFDQSISNKSYAPAILYHREGGTYVFAVIAKSKVTERPIEVKNVVGFDAGFTNLDSTHLGTAFFYLTLFECDEQGSFSTVWESLIPIHTGFNTMRLKRWGRFKVPYVELGFFDSINSGFRNYNYFLVNGILNKPHLLETYTSIARRRELADVDKNKWPDYYEWRFVNNDSLMYVQMLDSLPFYWDTIKNMYVTKYSNRWKRKY